MKKFRDIGCVFIFFLFLTTLFFRSYIFSGRVPVAFNLLVSFYSPWKYEPIAGYPNGVPNKPIGTDIPKLFYPLRAFTTSAFTNATIPLWNPRVFAGNVHAATYQSAIFYPFNVLYHVLPQVDAWSLLVMTQPVIAGIGMFLFLRTTLSWRGALFGAVSYACSGWMIAWWEESIVIEHSILWLPWALYGSNLIWINRRKLGFAILVFALTMSVLAGFLQMSIYLGITVILWNIYQWRLDKRQGPWVPISIAVASAFLLSAVQWAPGFEAYTSSARGTTAATFLFEESLMPLTHIITLVAPDFWGNPGSYNYFFKIGFYHDKVIFIGIIPLIFALYGLFVKKGKSLTFWKLYTPVVLSLGFALPTSWVWYVLKIPILSVAQPSRVFALFAFGASVLAAYGLERYLVKPDWVRMKRVLSGLTVATMFLWIVVIAANVAMRKMTLDRDTFSRITLYATVSLRNLIPPTAFLLAAWGMIGLLMRRTRALYASVLIVSIVSSLYFANKFLYFSDRQFEFPKIPPIAKLEELSGINRFWSYGNAYMEKNIPSYFNLYSPEGYDALFSSRYGELMYTIKNNGVITDQIPRTDVDLKPMGESERMTDNPIRLRLMSLLGVKYILETKMGEGKEALSVEDRFDPKHFTLAWEDDRWRIWEYTSSVPRIAFVPGYQAVSDDQKIAEALLDDSFDFSKTVILEKEIEGLAPDQPATGSGVVIMKEYSPTMISVSVDAATPGFVFLSDTYAPGWKAYVDGGETKIYRANYAFRAVEVGAGAHEVVMEYTPWSFALATYMLSAGAIVVLIGLFIL